MYTSLGVITKGTVVEVCWLKYYFETYNPYTNIMIFMYTSLGVITKGTVVEVC